MGPVSVILKQPANEGLQTGLPLKRTTDQLNIGQWGCDLLSNKIGKTTGRYGIIWHYGILWHNWFSYFSYTSNCQMHPVLVLHTAVRNHTVLRVARRIPPSQDICFRHRHHDFLFYVIIDHYRWQFWLLIETNMVYSQSVLYNNNTCRVGHGIKCCNGSTAPLAFSGRCLCISANQRLL